MNEIDMNDDFWRGIVFGYPLCCIDFYINFWNPVRSKHFMFHGRPECYDWKNGAGYVQCPECVIRGLGV